MSTLPALPCYLNGDYTDLANAKVSVMDRGFIFGDGIYEVVPAYGGTLFRFDEHMARLQRSLNEVRLANPMTPEQWHVVARELMRRHAHALGQPIANTCQLVYIQVTRGVALRDHAMPANVAPTVFVMVSTMNPPSAQQRQHGVRCVSAEDFRWEKAHIKSVSLLGSVLARQISADADCAETIMFRRGFLSEASASNVWLVKDGVLLGPPKNHLMLTGIRYGLIEEICQALGQPLRLRPIARDELLHADEIILSSATKEVLAVTELDATPVGSGKPGPVYQQLAAAYQAAIAQAQAADHLPTAAR